MRCRDGRRDRARKIVAGRSDRSYGIQVAQRAGIPPAVLRMARSFAESIVSTLINAVETRPKK